MKRTLFIVAFLPWLAWAGDVREVVLETREAACRVALHGAKIESLKLRGSEVLWTAETRGHVSGKWSHGGIPLCWPWFSWRTLPSGAKCIHGFAADRDFALKSQTRTPDRATLVLGLRENDLELEYRLTLTDRLQVVCETTNRGTAAVPFSLALHPYFLIGERNRTRIVGADGRDVLDLRNEPTDDGFDSAKGGFRYVINDPVLMRQIIVSSADASSCNIWNCSSQWPPEPCAEIDEMPFGAWRKTVSVEPVKDYPDRPLAAGVKATLEMTVAVEPIRRADVRLPVVDISGDTARQVVIAEGTKDRYEGHPTTLLADDGKTMFCVWTTGHGGPCGQMARSDDGGRTWTRIDSVLPSVYARTHRNCPTLQKVKGPDGRMRYFIYSCKAAEGKGLGIMTSEDLGQTWTELPCQSQLSAGMPPTGLMTLTNGTVALFGQLRNDSKVRTDRATDDQSVWMALSTDGGRSYGPMRVVMTAKDRNLCEPSCLRSPDGKTLVLLARENRHRGRSMMSFSEDEGQTWTTPADTPWALTGDRHEGILLPDGRYLIAFRDQALGSPTRGQFMAWVGTFDDLRYGRDGQYRIHLLRHHGLGEKSSWSHFDTGYSGVELLPDGTIVCTTYSRHFADERQSSVVSTRFKIAETDLR